MKRTLHLAGGLSTGGSMRQAFREAGLADEVLPCPDVLSCGPIKGSNPISRAAWWDRYLDGMFPEYGAKIAAFWNRLDSSDERLVAWIGKRSAKEHAFLLAVAHHLGERPFSIVDVAEPRDPPLRNPTTGNRLPGVVSILPNALLRDLIGTERPVLRAEHAAMRDRWQALRQEDAPFRITMGPDLVSAPADHFDAALTAEATTEPRSAARIIGKVLSGDHAYLQVGDMMLHTRLVGLIEAGKLVADGDPWDMRACLVRLPG